MTKQNPVKKAFKKYVKQSLVSAAQFERGFLCGYECAIEEFEKMVNDEHLSRDNIKQQFQQMKEKKQ